MFNSLFFTWPVYHLAHCMKHTVGAFAGKKVDDSEICQMKSPNNLLKDAKCPEAELSDNSLQLCHNKQTLVEHLTWLY